MEPCQKKMRLKCLSAFGFWGTRQVLGEALKAEFGLKCLSAFGFWGTDKSKRKLTAEQAVSNAFRLLGSGELRQRAEKTKDEGDESQMPFGFWVLGN